MIAGRTHLRQGASQEIVWLLLLALSGLLPASPVQAQSGIELEDVGASVQFGEQVTFVATIKSSITGLNRLGWR